MIKAFSVAAATLSLLIAGASAPAAANSASSLLVAGAHGGVRGFHRGFRRFHVPAYRVGFGYGFGRFGHFGGFNRFGYGFGRFGHAGFGRFGRFGGFGRFGHAGFGGFGRFGCGVYACGVGGFGTGVGFFHQGFVFHHSPQADFDPGFVTGASPLPHFSIVNGPNAVGGTYRGPSGEGIHFDQDALEEHFGAEPADRRSLKPGDYDESRRCAAFRFQGDRYVCARYEDAD